MLEGLLADLYCGVPIEFFHGEDWINSKGRPGLLAVRAARRRWKWHTYYNPIKLQWALEYKP